MRKRIGNIEGGRFNRWIVLGFSHVDKNGHKVWACRCDCGRDANVVGENLTNNRSRQCKSCSVSKEPGVSAFNTLYSDYRTGARKRGLVWDLSEDQFRKITSSPCYYTGLLPQSVSKTAAGEYVYNGIDRLDSSKGYTPENCVPCNGRINEMKMSASLEDFVSQCRLVVNHFSKKAAA